MDAPPVQYVRTADGYDIAYRVTGTGMPCVMVPPILHHLELQAEEVLAWTAGLAELFRFVEYDCRGQGLSTRGLPDTFSMTDFTIDLEAIFGRLDLGPAALFAVGTACHTAVRFSVNHPQRVASLILVSPSLITGPWWPASLTENDWRGVLSIFVSSRGSLEAADRAKQRLSQMVTQEDAIRMHRASQASRIDSELAELRASTLVLHPRESQWSSLQECADLARRIANARLAQIGGGWQSNIGEFESALPVINAFLAEHAIQPSPSIRTADHDLSTRESEVLRLLAAGRSNQQIADELVISVNTVIRHVANIFDKTGAANRAQATAYAKDHGIA